MSFLKTALRSTPVKQAILCGWEAVLTTGEASKALDAMLSKGRKNGAVTLVKLGICLDVLVLLSNASLTKSRP